MDNSIQIGRLIMAWSRIQFWSLIIILFSNLFCWAANEKTDTSTIEEIPAVLKLKNVGTLELLLLRQNERIYYPIEQLFNFLSIKIDIDRTGKLITGFFPDKENQYSIDFSENMLGKYNSKKYTLEPDYVKVTDKEIYLVEDVYREMFGLALKFDLRKLSVELKSIHQIPVVTINNKRKRREKILSSREIQLEPYQEKYRYKFFNGSTLDWRLNSISTKGKLPNYKYSLGSGSRIFGSDLQITINGIVYQPIKDKDINGFLRIPFFENNYLSQIVVGDLTSLGQKSFGRVRGIELTNRPARRRIIQGSDEIKVNVRDSQELETYQVGQLISYQPAPTDAQYNVNIKLPYGISDYELRAHDQWGGVDRYLYRYNIPYSMLPDGEFQYSVRAGNLRYRNNERYGKVLFEYGATNLITMGAELQYLNNSSKTKFYPAGLATVRLTKGLTSEFSFSPFLNSLSKINIVFPSDALLMLSHEFLNKNSPLNPSKLTNQASFNLRLPFIVSRGLNTSGIYFDQSGIYSKSDIFQMFTYISQFGAYVGGFQYSMISIYNKSIQRLPTYFKTSNWSTNANFSTRLPVDVVFTVSSNYNHNLNKVGSIGLSIAKGLPNFYLTASYERTFQPNITIANLNISYYLPFVRSISNINRIQGNMSYNQTLQGSVVTSGNFKNYHFDYKQMLGKGVINFKPYHDSNNNGIKEKEEYYITGVKMNLSSAIRGVSSKKTKEGLIINYPQPYQNYTAVIPQQTLENPNWVAKYQSISTIAEPNAYKIIDIPFVDGGIISGSVVLLIGDKTEPVGGITVVIEELFDGNNITRYENKTFTFSTGRYDFLNVPPGKYKVTLLNTDLDQLKCMSVIGEHIIEIISQPEGHVLENIDFGLIKIE